MNAALRIVQLMVGLALWGFSVALFVRSGLGLGPWDAFHYGLHVQTGISIGVASILVGVIIVAVTIAMGVRPGIATVLNMIFIGVFIDLLLPLVPDAPALPWAVMYYVIGIPLCGIASGLYIGAGYGHGPRDGLMVALTLRSGSTVGRIRTIMEVTVLVAGWAMGAVVGIGTIVFAATIGYSVHWGLKLFGAVPDPDANQTVPPRRPFRRAA